MSWFDGLRHRLRPLLDPRGPERDVEDEMRFHLELDAMHERDPFRARRRFGSPTYYREEIRRASWLGKLDTLGQDARYAWRATTRTPGFTALVVLTLALGIGLNSATFALLDVLYLRPPSGVAEPAALRRVWVTHYQIGDGVPFTTTAMNYPMYQAIAAAAPDPGRVAVFTVDGALRQGPARSAPRIRGAYASASYFPVLGVRPERGRFYTADEARPGSGAQVVVLSHHFWRTRLGADAGVIGKTIPIGRQTYTIIGIARRSFTGLDLEPVDVWMPLGSMPAPPWVRGPWWESSSLYGFRAIQRLGPGTGVREFEQRATAAVRVVNRRQRPAYPDTSMTVSTGPIVEARGPGKPGQELLISTRLGAVGVAMLFIAWANVINLLLARAVRRRREIAVRLALGISRWRLVRLLTVETLLLASIASVGALIAGWWGGRLLRSLLLPEVEWIDSPMDWRVVLFTISVALVSGLLAGIVPAIQSSNPRLADALKAGSRGGSGRSRLRGVLVVTQAALSVVLLVGAALFVRSLQNVQGLDIGFDADRLVFGEVRFDEGAAPPDAVVGAVMEQIASRLRSRTGVEDVARAGMQPMRGISFITFFSGADSSGSFTRNHPVVSLVTSSFFRAAGIRVVRGSTFSRDDASEVVVNEAMARLLWPGREPLGQCMRFVKRENPCYRVVGVVETVRRDKVIEREPAPQYYLPLGNVPTEGWHGTTLVARARAGAHAAATAELRDALRRAFPNAEVRVVPMTANLEPEYRPWRLGATLFTAVGVLALVVALVGIYSTVSYGVSQRTHEFGVRMALGARMGDVLRHVLAGALRVVMAGVAVGIALSLAAGRLVAALLYGVQPGDPAVVLAVAGCLLGVAALAALLPAWRAAQVDPALALKAE